MKKFFILLATALIAVLPLSARTVSEPDLSAKTETKEYQLNNFTGLDVSWIYQVDLVQASRHAVRVDAPANAFISRTSVPSTAARSFNSSCL